MSDVPLYPRRSRLLQSLSYTGLQGGRKREREGGGGRGEGGGGGIQKILKVIYIFQVMRLCLNRCVDLE